VNLLLLIPAILSCAAALLPAVVLASNWRRYAQPAMPTGGSDPVGISLLIPARDEAAGIGDCLAAALASRGITLEVIVLDDGSSDATASIVAEWARRDPRVRLAPGLPLPAGWCGKQHACWQLAQMARHPVLVFIDADVRLEPDGLARAAGFLHSCGAALCSGLPRQQTGTLAEKLLIPLIHFVLLGFLPLRTMRESTSPAYGAGCGQLFLSTRAGYDRAGGHAAIRASLHDGISLPRAYRRAGLTSDLFDATSIARCRMYRSGAATWHGLAKNATEGMAGPEAIVPWTLVLGLGQVMPVPLMILTAASGLHGAMAWAVMGCAGIATAAGYSVRFALVGRFEQSWVGALLHPIGVAGLLAVQWYAVARQWAGWAPTWRGRAYRPDVAKQA
jgi:hypothetical protein